MAGGIGSRFWPVSREDQPKQFLDILGTGKTLIQQTFDRLKKTCPPENIYIVTNTNYQQLVLDQLQIDPSQVLCEPVMRNTAPAIAYPAFKILQQNPDANLVVAPSDHVILDEAGFTAVLDYALIVAAQNDWLITLGIKPSRPDTGYGYIQYDKVIRPDGETELRKVLEFREKPDLSTAKSFVQSGNYLWNAGIFVWSLKSIIRAFKQHLPAIYQLFSNGAQHYFTSHEPDFIDEIYPDCQNISIDYGVMEKAENVFVIRSEFGWSDLGTWGSLYDLSDKDQDCNAMIGGSLRAFNAQGNILYMPAQKKVVLQGVKDLIIVEDNDVLLICNKKEEQEIKKIVNVINKKEI